MKYLKYLFIVLLIIQLNSCKDNMDISDRQAISFIKYYGGEGEDIGNDVKQTADDGYAIVGTTTTPEGDKDAVFIKTDKFGNLEWKTFVGGDEDDFGNSFIIDNNGDYLMVGTTTRNDTSNIFVTKLSETTQDTVWSKTYNYIGFQEGISLVKKPDNNLFILGNMLETGTTNKYMFVIKSNPEDTSVNTMKNTSDVFNYTNSIINAFSDKILIFGSNKPNFSPTIIYLNDNLGNSSTKTFTEINDINIQQVVLNSAGNIVFIANYPASSSAGDIYIGGISGDFENGDPEYFNLTESILIEGNLNDEGNSIALSETDDIIILGTSETEANGKEIFLKKINSDGSDGFEKYLGGIDDDEGKKVAITSDGGIILTGSSAAEGNQKICLIKTNSEGNLDIE